MAGRAGGGQDEEGCGGPAGGPQVRSPQFPRGKEPPVASLLQTLGPLSGDGLPAEGAGHSRPRSHGRSEQSPGVANSGRGQLCSGAEAVISGLENSCPEQAPQACPFSGAVIFPRGPSWPLLALCPLPTPFPSKVHGLCRAPHRETKMGGGVAGRRPHQRSIPGQRQPGGQFLSLQLLPAGATPEP